MQEEPNYQRYHEEQLRRRALRGKWILGKKSLWTLNRLGVMRGLWKMVAVPGHNFRKQGNVSVVEHSQLHRDEAARGQKDGTEGPVKKPQ